MNRRIFSRLSSSLAGLAFLGAMLLSTPSRAQAPAGGGLEAWTYEFSPVLGVVLPYDFWGVSGTLNAIGLRNGFGFPWGILEASFLVLHKDPDRAYVGDVGFRWDLNADFGNAYFIGGLHFSKFNLVLYDEERTNNVGTVITSTDSGFYTGFMAGGGILIPLKPKTPLRLGMRYYKNPNLWLLLEAGIGFRF